MECIKVYDTWSPTKKIVFASILSIFASFLQSAGGYLPGVGFLVSPFSTIPILLSVMISLKHGSLSYFLAIFLLILIEPSELFIFPFGTGLLGLGIGWGIKNLNKPMAITILNGILLLIGISIPLYGLGFPILGPISPKIFRLRSFIIIFGFSCLYSYIWLQIGLYIIRMMNRFSPPINRRKLD